MPQFYLPTEILTGRGCFDQLGKVVARYGKRALLVCGANFARRSGLLDRAVELLQDAGVQVTVFDGVRGEAALPMVQVGIELARQEGCRVPVGLGGGSAIDVAKAIAGLMDLPGPLVEYHNGRPPEKPALPWVAVPTTAGTGAEVTRNAVLIDPTEGVKKSIRDDSWFARAALVDPLTTVSMPPQVTASTGSDALAQAIESFTSIAAGPITDALAMRAIALIGAHLERAYRDGQDLEAREAMSMGSLMAGMAMASARLGGIHGIAHPLGSHFDIPHGVVCGLLLPYVMAYNLDYAAEKYAQVAALLGEPTEGLPIRAAAERAVERVRRLMRAIDLPEHLGPFGVRPIHFEQIIAETLPSGSTKHNPRPLGAEDVRAILEQAI
ncbi:MAG: iron-containing alcohol dehydrogenase [Chloroflexi bacterium]|nr:iron-containing alcohol dehydrogenase [Chloroflexota bacterium]